ncbi:MAG TPA: tetratricopeptide repeat protein, partial [Anaerolineales bacterium]|nr:tetratricopeptide repeat protein [Anaerolineales bacterium]
APPQVPAEAVPGPAAEAGDLPAWLAGLDQEGAPAASGAAAPSEELPAWLQAEMEPEPEANEPARPSDWRPVQPEVPAPPPAAPAAKPVAEKLPAQPVPEEPEEEPVPVPAVEPAPEPLLRKSSGTIFAPPPRQKPAAAPKPAGLSIEDARTQLSRGNIAASLETYSKLIRKGRNLDDIIRDLRDALYRYPVEVPLWQSLGDAYMRANRLQEALDAYTKAEELLR